jgi:hypothetical protein
MVRHGERKDLHPVTVSSHPRVIIDESYIP